MKRSKVSYYLISLTYKMLYVRSKGFVGLREGPINFFGDLVESALCTARVLNAAVAQGVHYLKK